jgi:hypothetical protein
MRGGELLSQERRGVVIIRGEGSGYHMRGEGRGVVITGKEGSGYHTRGGEWLSHEGRGVVVMQARYINTSMKPYICGHVPFSGYLS